MVMGWLATLGVVAAGLLACLPAFANTITYTIDGNLGEWSTGYPGMVQWNDLYDAQALAYQQLNINWVRQSIGYLNTNPPPVGDPMNSNYWYLFFGIEVNARLDTLADGSLPDSIYSNIYIQKQNGVGGSQPQAPSLGNEIDYFARWQFPTGCMIPSCPAPPTVS